MEHPKITKLYKYFDNHERVLKILKTGCIYCPKPNRFNDPFDCDIDIISSVSWDQFERRVRSEGEKLNKGPAEVERKIRSLRNDGGAAIGKYQTKVEATAERLREILGQRGIVSLSTIPDSIPMWSYYAAKHTGMCMEFQRSPENALGSTATKPVCYTASYPDLSILDLLEPDKSLSQTVMYTKSDRWKHEHEWRAVLTEGNVFHDLPGAITGVFLGLRTPKEYRCEVAKLVRNREEITLWQAVKAPRRFQISFVEYEP